MSNNLLACDGSCSKENHREGYIHEVAVRDGSKVSKE